MPKDYDFDDLIQEGYVVYDRCRRRYAATVENAKHFMRLYQVSFINRVHQVANIRTRRNETDMIVVIDGVESSLLNHVYDLESDGDFDDVDVQIMLREAPSMIIRVLERHNSTHFCRKDGRRETTNEYLCRIAEVKESRNLRKEIEAWARGNTNHRLGSR
jgi:hypothetical protein